jgi:glycopeptide antibiotics resistance protein
VLLGIVRFVGFVLTPMAVVALLVLLVASTVLAWWSLRSGRVSASFWQVFAANASLALILSVTVLREPWSFAWPPGDWSSDGWDLALTDPLRSGQVMANLLLFVPAGVAWTVLTRQPWWVLATLASLSMAIEVLQAVTATGANDLGDLLANTVGAAIGAATGWFAVRLREDRRVGRTIGPTVRRFLAGAVVVGVAATVIAQVGATMQLRDLEAELQELHAATSLTDVDRWQDEGRFTDMVLDATSVRADGVEYADDADSRRAGHAHVLVRYPATFLSARRCLFVRWTEGGVDTSRSGGGVCSRFMG